MKPVRPLHSISRRKFVRATSALAASALAAGTSPLARAAESPARASADTPSPKPGGSPHAHPLLTPAGSFRDVSRGDPKPYTLTGDALVAARLTLETWRLEMTAEAATDGPVKEPASLSKPRTLADGTALDLEALLELGRKHAVRFLSATQCLNIPAPLGQGLWEGVPLREVLRLGGALRNVRRIYFWGFHNHDPKQLFQSSLSYSQAMETPPGELPAFLAYRLNGDPIPLVRGGPVRMLVPWAHGFKSIKWLQRIVLTNDYRANDTYAEQNNDPDSHLKTAAYLDELPARFPAGQPVVIGGLVLSGWSGLQRVEYSLRRQNAAPTAPTSDDAEHWIECRLEDPPADWRNIFPEGVSPRQVLGFDARTGKPASWPLRYSTISWSATLDGLVPGKYAVRARAVDLNGFAQPEPRPNQKAGKNALDLREFEVV